MLVTEKNSDFFSPLSGKNGKIIESSIIYLYKKTYGDDFTWEEILDRKMVKAIISRVLQEIVWQDEYEENSLEKDRDKATYILDRLITCGWVVFEIDRGLSMRVFNFTKNGKKFAQMLYSLSDEDSVIVRQRNVRTTISSLEAYYKNRDPYDLIDAMTFSKHIVSDLTDNINDLKEEKNLLMQMAIEDVFEASGKFISFLEDDVVFVNFCVSMYISCSTVSSKHIIFVSSVCFMEISSNLIYSSPLIEFIPSAIQVVGFCAVNVISFTPITADLL